jgi:hypothetical protein
LFVAAALALSVAQAAPSPSIQQERTAAAALLALGRLPDAGAAHDGSVADLVSAHRKQLAADAALKRAVATKAFADAFGRAPTADESVADSGTYTELMQQHVRYLVAHADEYTKVLNRVYQLVIRRDVYPEEIEYWKKKDVQSFTVLVGCVDNWGRRNQPGLMVTAGPAAVSVNCVFLATVRLSPAVAAEARAAAGLPAVADPAAGTNLLAAGAQQIISDGRIHFAAALKD